MTRDPLLELATAISDGTPIDWTGAGRLAPAIDARAMEAAQVVSRLASLHASVEDSATVGGSFLPTLGSSAGGSDDPPLTWGSLKIGDRIGRGSFGDVYQARDPRLDRPVALKLCRRREPHDTTIVDEGRRLARVRHANVVTVYGAERIDGRAGLWMEFVDGRTLAEELAENGPLDAREVLRIGADLANALHAVHQAGLLHRDVKAQNVMRDRDGRVVLMDFGAGQEWTSEGDALPGLAGTPLYLAPEVLEGSPATVASDVYSLGVLLHLLATGTFPVLGRSIRDLRDAHSLATGPVVGPQARARMPRRLATAIARALAREPHARFASAARFADALKPAQIGMQWKLAGAVAAGVTIAVAGMAWMRPVPAPAGPGVTVEHISPDLQASAAFLGPAIGAIVPCAPRDLPASVSICDWQTGRVKATLRSSILGSAPGAPQFAVETAVLSPNASLVAYTWSRGRAGQRSLNVIDVKTGSNDVLLDAADVRVGRWTEDGRAVIVHELSGERRDMVVPINHAEPTTLFSRQPDDEPGDLSPDGRTLVIARPGEQDLDLVAIDVATGDVRWSLQHPGPDHGPTWTPDGRSIIFVNDVPGSRTLMALGATAEGAGAPRLIHRVGRSLVTPLGFAPDGWLHYSVAPPPRTVYVADFDSDRLTVDRVRLADPRTVETTVGPDWSGDGRLAYVSGLQDASAVSVVIGTGADGREETRLAGQRYLHPVALSLHGRQPSANAVRWSPDGRQLAVVNAANQDDPAGPSVLDLLDIGGAAPSPPRHILTARRIDNLRWDPSGTALWFLDAPDIGVPFFEARVLMRHDIGANRPVEFLRPEGCGALKAMDVNRHSGDIAVLTTCLPRWFVQRLPDGQRWELPPDWRECLAVAWVGDTPGVLISVYRTGSARGELWHFDTATGNRRQIALDTDFIFDLSLGADGRRLSYSAGNPLVQVHRVRGVTDTR